MTLCDNHINVTSRTVLIHLYYDLVKYVLNELDTVITHFLSETYLNRNLLLEKI